MTDAQQSPTTDLRQLGEGGPLVPALCFGTSPLGGMAGTYGYDADRARAAIEAMLDSDVHFLDTSNNYGAGESERRIGRVLADRGAPDDLVLATKADPAPGASTFTAERVHASFRESAERLGMDRFPVYHLHDPEWFDFDDLVAPGGALQGMVELKEQGLVDVIGVAGGDLEVLRRYLDTGVFDVVLTHNRFNLLDRTASPLIDAAVAAGVAVLNAAPYASGILAKPVGSGARFQYREAPDDVVEQVRWLHEACARFDVPLAALALQFSTHDPRLTSTVVGLSDPRRVEALLENAALPIPAELWQEVTDRLG